MQKTKFSIEVNAPREKVWQALWQDDNFRDWANIIDEGTHMAGELKEGGEVQFLSASGYGVTSLVEQLTPNESVTFRHAADTKDGAAREKEWKGGAESYLLKQNGATTILTVELDIPNELEEIIKDRQPKALRRVKELAEELI